MCNALFLLGRLRVPNRVRGYAGTSNLASMAQKAKILCLHGFKTNPDIMNFQVRKLFREDHDVENQKAEGGKGRVQGKGEGPRENWEKVQVLWICRGVVLFLSRVIRDEYRI